MSDRPMTDPAELARRCEPPEGTGDWEFHPRVFVPIILLRACRRVPAEAGR